MEPEHLTPHALSTFRTLVTALPQEVAVRLKCSRHVRRHGSAKTVLLFNIWDAHQTGLFDPKYFSYCLGYDPQKVYSETPWYLHLWINTTRVYQHSEAVRAALTEIVQRQCPDPFRPLIDTRSVQAVYRADFAGPLESFENYFSPLYRALIGALHPYLMPIVDSFIYDLTNEERAEVIASRKRFYCGPRRRLSAEEIRQYSRSIPESWRVRLIRSHESKCALCTKPIDRKTAHIDHIKPFSKGGPTILENLQPLCASCNLKKSNRE